MQRLRVFYRREAISDLAEIYRYIAAESHNPNIARAFVLRIKQRCGRIGDVPRGGRPRDDLRAGLRTVPFEHSAVIAYLVEDDRVRIVRIFYGRQDYEALMSEDATP